MVTNTGKPSEQAFENYWATLGKQAWLHRLVDAAEVQGRTGRATNIRPAPSDYLLVHRTTVFAEVKSTTDAVYFPFRLLRKTQSAIATMIMAAGGEYLIFAHCLPTNHWYRIPYTVVQATKDTGRSSLKWKEIESLEWKI